MGVAELAQDLPVVMEPLAHPGIIEDTLPGSAVPRSVFLQCCLLLSGQLREDFVALSTHWFNPPKPERR